jgi:hypothetical protein
MTTPYDEPEGNMHIVVEDWPNVVSLHAEADTAKPSPGQRPKSHSLIKSGADFLADFTPPDYLWDGILLRRFCYSLTAQTGTGKTAVSLLLAVHVARGMSLGGREMEQGRVLYFAGENPDDVRMRMIGMEEELGFSTADLPIHFVDGRQDLGAVRTWIKTDIEALGGVSLIIFDTRAAFFHGTDINNDVEVVAEARLYRSYVEMPGGPTVVVNSHPIKNVASKDDLLPKGGGAFLNDIDGNLTLERTESGISLHKAGKFRGPDFTPIPFGLRPVSTPRLRDKRGRLIPTVVAREVDPATVVTLPKAPKVTGKKRVLLDVITAALDDLGQYRRDVPEVPRGRKAVPKDKLDEHLFRAGYWDEANRDKRNILRASLSRDLLALKGDGLVGICNGLIWRAR